MSYRHPLRAGALLAVVTVLLAAPGSPAAAGRPVGVQPGATRPVAAQLAAARPSAALAARADEPRWSVQPSSKTGPTGKNHFVYDLSPGEQIVDYVGISNLGSKPIALAVYATDAFNSVDGAYALLPTNQQPRDVGSWIALPAKSFTIAPGKRLDVPFHLKVPQGAEPGDHPGAVVAAMTVQQTNQHGQQVTVERRIGARVYLRVHGPVKPAVQITGIEVQYDNPAIPLPGGDLAVTYRVANLGNVRVTGKARIRVNGPLGIRLGNSEMIDIPELLPDSEIRLTSKISGVFPAGQLSASLVVNPATVDKKDPVRPATRNASVSAVPWTLLVVILLACAALLLVLVRRRQRRQLLLAAGRRDADDGPSGLAGGPTAAAPVGRRATAASG